MLLSVGVSKWEAAWLGSEIARVWGPMRTRVSARLYVFVCECMSWRDNRYSCRRMCYQQNLQLVRPVWRLCMKADVKAERRRKPASGPFPNGPLASSCLNQSNRIILELWLIALCFFLVQNIYFSLDGSTDWRIKWVLYQRFYVPDTYKSTVLNFELRKKRSWSWEKTNKQWVSVLLYTKSI